MDDEPLLTGRPEHAEAIVSFLLPTEGGRYTPTLSGYRAQFTYHGEDWDSIHTYPDNAIVHPGETVRTILRFARPEVHCVQLYVGMEFEVREGPHVVGRGNIVRILAGCDHYIHRQPA